ncbi:iron(III) transport system substrate-binding protein [Yoonia tamlensis]|uniref:Iron(III) transport system substrate-binding protein n=1 Tax=Yoonia tamlensis TaxID=390270 RepID=A0A1I6GFI0_9RHOB|nr:Fe(3+) ABC transporter substrate-binding protein [Yoonia tamlensis]SFR40952.1 iron(III) transport system substrate-binding protein [Yoonia tamlensis]
MTLRTTLLATACAAIAAPAVADVNIYTTRQPELIQPVMDAFTAQTGIAVNLAYVDDGLVERLKAEGARSPADLVMTVDIANLMQIVEAGVIQPVESDVLTAAVPENLRSSDNLWFGLTTRARIIYASRDRVADGEVTTYEDLASDKWEGRICTRSGVHNYNLALTSAVIAHLGEEGASAWAAGVHENLARKPEGNDRAQVKAIWAGECDISLGNTYYMGQMLSDPEQTEWANSVRIIFPTFENGGTHVNISGVAMTNAAPNRAEALQLMEYLVSPEAQAIYAESNFEYPVLADAPLSELVASWGTFDADTVKLDELAGHRPTALRIMEEVNFDG